MTLEEMGVFAPLSFSPPCRCAILMIPYGRNLLGGESCLLSIIFTTCFL